MLKQIILVGGVDYEFKGVDFRVFCDNRLKRIAAANTKKDDLRCQIFDIRRGEVKTTEIKHVSGKATSISSVLSPSPFAAVSKANYDATVSGGETHYTFKNGQGGIISILDIYRAVQQVGISAPNSLSELSIFSHAFMGGPILVNSFDDGQFVMSMPFGAAPFTLALPSGMRDPDDFDPRSKDFTAPTTSATDLANFRKAFAPDALIWIWGCTFPRLVHEILHKIERHPTYRDSGLGDDVVFRIKTFNTAQSTLLQRAIQAELGGPFPNLKDITVKFKFLKYFFCKMTIASYLHHLAVASNVRTFGGVMGTYSEYDTGKLPLMSVHKGFARHFTFYKNYLGFDFDKEGRKYGEYKPTFTCTVPTP